MKAPQVHPLQAIALQLAMPGREIDAAEVAQAIGQNPASPAASAYRRTAEDLLHRLTKAGLLRKHGKAPRHYWTAAHH